MHDEPFADIKDADVEAEYLALMGEAQAARAPPPQAQAQAQHHRGEAGGKGV